MYFSKIKYMGNCIPELLVKNDDLSKIVDTNDEWITTRCGISERHVSKNENTSDLAANAVKKILDKGNINPLDIELIVLATVSSDYATPSTACLVQAEIGAKNAVAFDISAACSGFVYGLSIADKFIKSGVYKNAIVIGSEVLSKSVDWTDRTTCVMFADGAAAAFVERSESGGILAEDLGSDGSKGMSLTSGYLPPSNMFNSVDKNVNKYIQMNGKEVFEFATRTIPKSIRSLIEKYGIDLNEIKYIVPHQANSRIVEIIARKLKVPMTKFYLNIMNYGNTSSASIPIALSEMLDKNLINDGDKIIITGFGGGLTWGSMIIQF